MHFRKVKQKKSNCLVNKCVLVPGVVFGMTGMFRGCYPWNTSVIALPPSGQLCVPYDQTALQALGVTTVSSSSGTICVCSTDNCNDYTITSAPVPESTTVTDQVNVTTPLTAPVAVTTPLPAQPTAGAHGIAYQGVLFLYLLCITELSLLY